MRLRTIAFAGLLATAALAAPAAAGPDPTGLSKLCQGLAPVQDCLEFACFAAGAAGPLLGVRDPGCLALACAALQASGRIHHCTVSEILCEDVQPLYATVVRPPAVAAVGSVISTLTNNNLPAPALPILQSILVRAGFYCDPASGGGVGAPCPEWVTTSPVRVGNRDFAFHDLGLGPVPLLDARDCAWVISTVGGTVVVHQWAWNTSVVDLGSQQTDCRLHVLVVVSSPASHVEQFTFVYC